MNLDQLRRDLTAKQEEARTRYAAVTQAAEKENRLLNDDDRKSVQALVDEAAKLKAQIDRAESDAAIGKAIESLQPVPVPPVTPRTLTTPASQTRAVQLLSMGQQFTQHENYQFFRTGLHRRGSAWVSPSTDLIAFDEFGRWAATLTEDPASGGKLVVPDYRPGIQSMLFRRLVVADLIAPGTTDSNLVSYMRETTFTNAADTVAEGALKPESTLIFDAVSDPVRKIAHWLPVSEEMLEDVAQIRSYIDARLRLGVQLTEEDQLLQGTTVAPDIVGIRNRTGLAPAVPAGTDGTADAVFKQMMAIATTSLVMPDGIVMNPKNWSSVQLSKNEDGSYVGSGPFAAPQAPMLWGLPVVVTPIMPADIALVGAFGTMSQVFRKGGIRVEASNSHADFFVKNLVAIRAEERLALAVYRPSAFGEVTGLDPVTP